MHYDPDTGVFTRLLQQGRASCGEQAGSLSVKGYWQITVDSHRLIAHRLAFLYMTGEWPKDGVDHIDGTKTNNAWGNLRDTPQEVNVQNRRGPNSGNSTGMLGVSYDPRRNKYTAQIMTGRKNKHLGRFDTPEEAHQVYLTAKRELHAGCTL